MSDAGWVDDEHRWPITYWMPSLTILLATARATSFNLFQVLRPVTPSAASENRFWNAVTALTVAGP